MLNIDKKYYPWIGLATVVLAVAIWFFFFRKPDVIEDIPLEEAPVNPEPNTAEPTTVDEAAVTAANRASYTDAERAADWDAVNRNGLYSTVLYQGIDDKGAKYKAAVRALQHALGDGVKIDGDFGPKTAASLKRVTGRYDISLKGLKDFYSNKQGNNTPGGGSSRNW